MSRFLFSPAEVHPEGMSTSKLLKIVKAPSRIWMDYCGRNRHGQRPVLEENDIIWGQPVDPAKELASWKSEDIQSLQ